MRRCEKLVPAPTSQEDDELALHVRNALERFGAAELTERESEVIQLVLRGHNTESVATQLGIASATAKLHRRRAYAKLSVGSQGELFFKFLETLDPLA